MNYGYFMKDEKRVLRDVGKHSYCQKYMYFDNKFCNENILNRYVVK